MNTTKNKTNVINCKVQYLRPKYNNLEEWMKDPNNIYIGRANVVFINKMRFPKKASIFSNPFKIGKDGTREEVCQKYKSFILQKITKDETLKNELLQLKGKNLGCWCFPEMCHGNIICELIDEFETN